MDHELFEALGDNTMSYGPVSNSEEREDTALTQFDEDRDLEAVRTRRRW
jgi:hypothetical protein